MLHTVFNLNIISSYNKCHSVKDRRSKPSLGFFHMHETVVIPSKSATASAAKTTETFLGFLEWKPTLIFLGKAVYSSYGLLFNSREFYL